MREIKYRAWNGKGIFVELFDSIYELQKADKTKEEIDSMVFEQFTGLRDKNGREIYEGDVVQFRMSYKTETWIGEVKYEECVAAFMISAMNGEPWCSREFGIGTIEPKIIGNIHENPELLK